MSYTISTQGEEGSFHHEAVQAFFGDDTKEIVNTSNFAEAVELLVSKKVDRAVVAIENSLYGTINTVYDLLLQHPVTICGEVYLHIEQNLIGLPGTDLQKILEVHSHPVALAQCEDYLDKVLPQARRMEHHDTAASVADVKKWADPKKAAIASKTAASIHNLAVLAKNIETNKQNYTRFIILARTADNVLVKDPTKTSIILQTPRDTRAGALYRALGVFAKHDINLFSLHSRPIVGKAWHYLFYIDIAIASSNQLFKELLLELHEQGCEVSVLGSYQNRMK